MSDNNGHADEILRKMARIRESLDGDFEGIVREARTLGNWHYYLRRYPLLSVAAAFGVGYLLVPRRIEIQSPDEKALAKLARRQKLVVQPRSAQAPPSGLLSGAFGFLFRLVLNGGLTYLGQHLAKTFDPNQRAAQSPAAHGSPAGRQQSPAGTGTHGM